MEHMESRMQDQIEGAQCENDQLRVRVDRLERALTAVRKAAGSSRHFTNRLQFIYERAGVALADEEWNEEWKATHGYTMRATILSENDRLKAELTQLQQRIAELEAEQEIRNEALEEFRKVLVSITPEKMKEKHPFDFMFSDEVERAQHRAEVAGWNNCRKTVMDAADKAYRALQSQSLPSTESTEKDAERLLVDVHYQKGDHPFIFGVYGKAPLHSLAEIETRLCESIAEEEALLTDEGEYRFAVHWEPEQRGDFGRVEFEGYWDLTRVSFQPLDAAIAQKESDK